MELKVNLPAGVAIERAANTVTSTVTLVLTRATAVASRWWPWTSVILLPTPSEAAIGMAIWCVVMAIALELGWLGEGRRLKDQTIL